ncbi:uncharacterized protein V1518DRAFT_416258 [Limtongia smithiae]|uniref:uncharacterized protein n=1 Tax=Limtongia smithiae TaxID=1125753 RepID=UPI0034D01036
MDPWGSFQDASKPASPAASSAAAAQPWTSLDDVLPDWGAPAQRLPQQPQLSSGPDMPLSTRPTSLDSVLPSTSYAVIGVPPPVAPVPPRAILTRTAASAPSPMAAVTEDEEEDPWASAVSPPVYLPKPDLPVSVPVPAPGTRASEPTPSERTPATTSSPTPVMVAETEAKSPSTSSPPAAQLPSASPALTTSEVTGARSDSPETVTADLTVTGDTAKSIPAPNQPLQEGISKAIDISVSADNNSTTDKPAVSELRTQALDTSVPIAPDALQQQKTESESESKEVAVEDSTSDMSDTTQASEITAVADASKQTSAEDPKPESTEREVIPSIATVAPGTIAVLSVPTESVTEAALPPALSAPEQARTTTAVPTAHYLSSGGWSDDGGAADFEGFGSTASPFASTPGNEFSEFVSASPERGGGGFGGFDSGFGGTTDTAFGSSGDVFGSSAGQFGSTGTGFGSTNDGFDVSSAGFGGSTTTFGDSGMDPFSDSGFTFAPVTSDRIGPPGSPAETALAKIFPLPKTIDTEQDNIASFFSESTNAPTPLLSFGKSYVSALYLTPRVDANVTYSRQLSYKFSQPTRQFFTPGPEEASPPQSPTSSVHTGISHVSHFRENGMPMKWHKTEIRTRVENVVGHWKSARKDLGTYFDWDNADSQTSPSKMGGSFSFPPPQETTNRRPVGAHYNDSNDISFGWSSSNTSAPQPTAPAMKPLAVPLPTNPSFKFPSPSTQTLPHPAQAQTTDLLGPTTSTPTIPQPVIQPLPMLQPSEVPKQGQIVIDDNDWGALMSSSPPKPTTSSSLDATMASASARPALRVNSSLGGIIQRQSPQQHHRRPSQGDRHRSPQGDHRRNSSNAGLYIPPPKTLSPASAVYQPASSATVSDMSIYGIPRKTTLILSPTAPTLMDAQSRDNDIVQEIVDSIPDITYLLS